MGNQVGRAAGTAAGGRRIRVWMVVATLALAGCVIPSDQAGFRTVDEQCRQSGVGHEVEIQPTGFFPRDLTVGIRHCVVWVNLTNQTHTVSEVRADGAEGPYDSQDIPPGATYTIWFGGAQDFSYRCLKHPTMGGAVHIREGVSVTPGSSASSPVPTTTTGPASSTSTSPTPSSHTSSSSPPPTSSSSSSPPPSSSSSSSPPPTSSSSSSPPPSSSSSSPPPSSSSSPPPSSSSEPPPSSSSEPPPSSSSEPPPSSSSEPPPSSSSEPPP